MGGALGLGFGLLPISRLFLDPVVQLFILYYPQNPANCAQLLYYKDFQMVLVRPHKRCRSLPNYISDPFRSRREQSVFPKCIALTFPSQFSILIHCNKLRFFISLQYISNAFIKDKITMNLTHISSFCLFIIDLNMGLVS